MSNRFVGVERSSGKTAEASATVAGSPAASASARFDGLRDVHSDRVTRTLKLTDAGAIDGNEPENSWLFPGFQYWLVVLCRDAMVGVRLLPWFEATSPLWRSTPTPRELAIWIGKTDPRRLRESPLILEVAHAKVG